MLRFRHILALLILIPFASHAQKVRNVSGEYTYYPPENVSLEQARQTAIERARLDAIAKEFGTNVSQISTVTVSANNSDAETGFNLYGGTEVKGDWISDTRDPETTISYDKDMLMIVARVWGKARERNNADLQLEIKTLCNGIESERFKNNDRISVHFRTPVKGFLSIWLADDNAHQCYCLMPYEDADGKARAMESRKMYTLLSTADPLYPYDEETIMTAEREIEYNRLIFIFSTASFAMPLTEQGEFLPELSSQNFDKWLQRNRIKDENMYVTQKAIEIRR